MKLNGIAKRKGVRCVFRNAGTHRLIGSPRPSSQGHRVCLPSAPPPEEQRSIFECFPYVCPEPVLVNCPCFGINGSQKDRFSTLTTSSGGAVTSGSTNVRTSSLVARCETKRNETKRNASYLRFPSVCPEPVLANRRF
jgi:hypothetical protein